MPEFVVYLKQQKEERKKLIRVFIFFIAINFTNFKLLNFGTGTEKYLCQLTKNWSSFNPKSITNLLSSWVDLDYEVIDPRSGKNKSRIRIQGSKKHRILDPQHCLLGHFFYLAQFWSRNRNKTIPDPQSCRVGCFRQAENIRKRPSRYCKCRLSYLS